MATFTNKQIMDTYKVGNQGGIRKSNKTQCVVLIINPGVHKYSDSFMGPTVINYDGAFRKGSKDQVMKYQNKMLAETNLPIHVYYGKLDQYRYIGEYERFGPYQTVYNAEGHKVFVFPLIKKFTYDFDIFEY